MQNVKISRLILERLFESPIKIKLLKLFLRNPAKEFSLTEMHEKLIEDNEALQVELDKLREIGFIQARYAKEDHTIEDALYKIDKDFIFFEEIHNLVLQSSPADEDKITKQIKGLGNIRIAILSGIFMQPEAHVSSRTDLLIVSDSMSNRRFNIFLKNLEAETGVEVNYTILTTEEYEYRRQMFDRFLLDVLEQPHRVLLENFSVV